MGNKNSNNDFDIYAINNQIDVITIKNTGILAQDFNTYANNFLSAGNLITNELIKTGQIAKLDTWYFALVYLYRQSLELMLKANIFNLESDRVKQKVIIGHVRHDLSQAFSEVIKLSNTNISSNDNLIWLEKYLKDISNIDRFSDMFRYPFGNDLSIVFDCQTHVDLIANYYNFNRAFDILHRFYKEGIFHTEKYRKKICYEPKLIVEGGSYYGQSVVGYKYNERNFYLYYTSYEECGKFLRDYMLNNFDDSLFMPMCYMFRNALELGLKRIIAESSHYEQTKKISIFKKKKHSLEGLWNSVCSELNINDSTIKMKTKQIVAFHAFDNKSDKFRYPCDSDLNYYFSKETKLDIRNFSNCFIELCDYLDAINVMLSEFIESEEEIKKAKEEELEKEYEEELFNSR